MKKSLLIFGVITLFSIVALSGCQEENTQNTNTFENIELESELVELANGNLAKNIQGNKIVSVSVEYYLRSIVDRYISINVTAEFYDKDNNLLYISSPKDINLPGGWEEHLANSASYDGEYASEVDYVRLVVEEN